MGALTTVGTLIGSGGGDGALVAMSETLGGFRGGGGGGAGADWGGGEVITGVLSGSCSCVAAGLSSTGRQKSYNQTTPSYPKSKKKVLPFGLQSPPHRVECHSPSEAKRYSSDTEQHCTFDFCSSPETQEGGGPVYFHRLNARIRLGPHTGVICQLEGGSKMENLQINSVG
mgnify:CR=1 FL=1